MSCASYLGSGHRIEFYGEDGTLVLSNTEHRLHARLRIAARQTAGAALERIAVEDPVDAQYPDGRIAPVSRLAKHFLDAIENGGSAQPDFAAGYRVQQLIDAAQRSHRQGAMIDVAPRHRAGEAGVSRILVTGGSGFIGSALVKALLPPGTACACSTTIRAAARAG